MAEDLAGKVLAGEMPIAEALAIASMQREITMSAAWDKRHPEPTRNCGIHGVQINWIVTGPKGGIVWGLFTNWHLPHVQGEFDTRTLTDPFVDNVDIKVRYHPMGGAIDYHALHRSSASQDQRTGCPFVPGGVCYMDVAYTAGGDLMKMLIEQGGEAVWKELEACYQTLPEKDAEPEASIVQTEVPSDA